MKKLRNPFKSLTAFEWTLLISSLCVVTLSFLLSPSKDFLTLAASLIGVTALIFVAKGLVFGQILIVIFALLYGVTSCIFSYYGEMITYVFMSAPAAVAAIISWLKHPFERSSEVKIARVSVKRLILCLLSSIIVSVIFYFVLKTLGTANLLVSTLSVATSFFASVLMFLRSPIYALAYSLNDIVLIVMWILASIEDPGYIPMIFCFVMFLLNDLYGFINWCRMRKKQGG